MNTLGVMGKGLALQFKNLYPNNFMLYAMACKNKELTIGRLLVAEEASLLKGPRTIINFPTKTHWRLPSEYGHIEEGLVKLAKTIKEKNIGSMAIPALGAGLGGLDWNRVKTMIETHLSGLDCEIFVYGPWPP